jgi:hypothetical protein
MSTVLDSHEKNAKASRWGNIINYIVYAYALLLTLMVIIVLKGIDIKTVPTPMEAEDPSEIQESYSMLAGICINVGECGNDQVVVGLKKNKVSERFYDFLVWKSQGNPE